MARLYADENIAADLVESLRQLGHDVLTAQENGRGNQRIPDPQVLADAIALERTVLTFNRRDFMRLHVQSSAHFGMVVCTYDPDLPALAQRTHEALKDQQDMKGLLVRIVRPNANE